MAIKKLFLCHPRTAAVEVHNLAEEIRLRGVVPWVDQHGGFIIGDQNAETARRVLREECSGLLLYATDKAFDSDFIGRVEIDEALQAKDDDSEFDLIALPRGMGFGQLAEQSIAAFGFDLTQFASRALGEDDQDGESPHLPVRFALVSRDLLARSLARAGRVRDSGSLSLQFSTRERLADEPDDVLAIDATQLFKGTVGVGSAEPWQRVHAGLRDVKQTVSARFGRPRLRVHGSKHLTAAFLFGFAFPSTAFEFDLRTKVGYWSTDGEQGPDAPLHVECREGSAESTRLHVELNTLDQPVQSAVRRHVRETRKPPFATLRMSTAYAPLGHVMANAEAIAIARQVRRELSRVVTKRPVPEIHLFAAVPQALATMIGHRLNAFPPIQLYEYDGGDYIASYVLRQDGHG